jgi:hypothetical protein
MSQALEKPIMDTKHLEDPEMNDKDDAAIPIGDYSGAVNKTDPREIALVRKLDMRIMPTLWCMYFMNYVSIFRPLTGSAVSNSHSSSIEMPLPMPDSTILRKIWD